MHLVGIWLPQLNHNSAPDSNDCVTLGEVNLSVPQIFIWKWEYNNNSSSLDGYKDKMIIIVSLWNSA